MKFTRIITLGIALFAMFFGAGNVVFPIALGSQLGDQVGWALVGLFLSAAFIPMMGVFGGGLFEGDYQAFFARIGKIPGFILALLCMILIGPFGATPRTITVAHAAISWYFPAISLFIFSLAAVALITFFTLKEEQVVDVIGTLLGPIKITLICAIIVAGFFVPFTTCHGSSTPLKSFLLGFHKGYMTLDLLGAMFLVKLILMDFNSSAYKNPRDMYKDLFKVGFLGALLLGVVYVGFMLIGAWHGCVAAGVGEEQIIFSLADYLLGRLGVLSSFTIAIACLVTAIALTAIFADYLHTVVTQKRLSYTASVLLSVGITGFFSNLGFSGIMRTIGPVVQICYPALIVLTALNIAYKLWGFKPVKVPFYVTLILTIVVTLGILPHSLAMLAMFSTVA